MRRPLSLALLAVVALSCAEPSAPGADSPDVALKPGGNGKPGGGGSSVKSVTVKPSSATVDIGQTVQLTAQLKPGNSTAPVTWSSATPGVATVTQTGLVTGVTAGNATITATAGGKSGSALVTVTDPAPPPPPPPPPAGITFVGAGDIASCASNGDEATALLLDAIPDGYVYTLGDNAYDNGTAAEFADCYDPTWGRHRARTYPSPGNHDYNTPNATPYYQYFGTAAGDPAKGYHSFDLGDWHIVVLNSNIARGATSAQVQWLAADLAANTKSCTLAYWHHPRFSSGSAHGNDTSVGPFWDVLYQYDADVVLGGHDHNYERFAPQTPAGAADPTRGIREFVVGTGGRSLRTLGSLKANSEVFDASADGVLKLTLSAGGYAWQFIPEAGKSFTDSGTGSCH